MMIGVQRDLGKNIDMGNLLSGISRADVFRYFAIGCVLSFFSDVPSGVGGAYLVSKFFLYAILVVSLFLPIRKGLIILLVVAVVGQDLIQTSTESEKYGAFAIASVWNGGIGGASAGLIMIFYCFMLFLKSKIYFRDKIIVWAVRWYSTVPLITGFAYGGIGSGVSWTEMIIDLKIPIFLLTSTLLYRSYFKARPKEIPVFASVFAGAVLARHIINFFYWVLGIGSRFAGVNRVSVDSTKGTVVFLLFAAIVLMVQQKKIIIGGGLGLVSALMLAAYSTRGLWVSAALGVFLLLFLMGERKKVFMMIVMAVLAYGSIRALMVFRPENLDLVRKRVYRQTVDETGRFLQDYFPYRYIELVNALDATMSRGAILWGSGYSSYYTESALPFPEKMKNAFPEYSLRSRKFYTLHSYVTRTIFENGLVGLIIISGLWLVPGWRCYRLFRKSSSSSFVNYVLAVVAFLPTSMLEMSWTGKGLVIAGYLIGTCICVYRRYYSLGASNNKNILKGI